MWTSYKLDAFKTAYRYVCSDSWARDLNKLKYKVQHYWQTTKGAPQRPQWKNIWRAKLVKLYLLKDLIYKKKQKITPPILCSFVWVMREFDIVEFSKPWEDTKIKNRMGICFIYTFLYLGFLKFKSKLKSPDLNTFVFGFLFFTLPNSVNNFLTIIYKYGNCHLLS